MSDVNKNSFPVNYDNVYNDNIGFPEYNLDVCKQVLVVPIAYQSWTEGSKTIIPLSSFHLILS